MTSPIHATTDMSRVRTGDALLFSCNTLTGLLLKSFTSSDWNHSGVAVRIVNSRVVLDGSGELCVLEINSNPRWDGVLHKFVTGAGYTDFSWVKERYNLISVRRLRRRYRTPNFARLVESFVRKHRKCEFTSDIETFISVGIGVPTNGIVEDKRFREMFCSEFMSSFYLECVGKPAGLTSMQCMFGEGCPPSPTLFTPSHFTYKMTPESVIFKGVEKPIFIMYSRSDDVIVPYLVLMCLGCLLVHTALP